MNQNLYPWPGKYETGNAEAPVAIVTLDDKFPIPGDRVAIWGPMKTENLGIEKVVANTLSNPYIRFVIVCGSEIRGHRSGESLVCLAKNGVDDMGRIIQAPGAVPYIENISPEAVQRFRDQVEIIDMVGETELDSVLKAIEDAWERNPGSFGEPYMAMNVTQKKISKFESDIALHSTLTVSPWGDVVKYGGFLNVQLHKRTEGL